ncbi:MAG: hypothetical protein MUC43_20375 [Pirellula sp.]|jgi:hypothetical protein|nr:hypothetical protein [Pirellula sp.]
MKVQVNAGQLVRAIASQQISEVVERIAKKLGSGVTELIEQFVQKAPSAKGTLELENSLFGILLNAGREWMQWLFDYLEPELEQLPGTVQHRGASYRRLAEKTRRADVLTRFGKVELIRSGYRRGRSGKTIFPVELLLGIEDGFTPAAADRVGKQFAATGSSQGRTLEAIEDQMGERIGAEKLRKLVGSLAENLEPLRQEAQVEKLSALLSAASSSEQKPVLSISRDGVALGLAPWGCFEMASVATVSVMAAGKRMGTVYLGCTPETNQKTLSAQLTSLLTETIRRCGRQLPEVVYVTDAGKVETAYWKDTLRKFFVDGERIKITRVVDYYHASERLTRIAEALNFGSKGSKRHAWLERTRKMLLEPGGHGRVLRSIAKMREIYGYTRRMATDAHNAEKYLRRYRRFMNYATMKDKGYPIGSGVVESACKQIVCERMKLSGMRWHRDGAQRTMTLRCILLSGIWDTVFKKFLATKPTVDDLILLETL